MMATNISNLKISLNTFLLQMSFLKKVLLTNVIVLKKKLMNKEKCKKQGIPVYNESGEILKILKYHKMSWLSDLKVKFQVTQLLKI